MGGLAKKNGRRSVTMEPWRSIVRFHLDLEKFDEKKIIWEGYSFLVFG